MRSKIWLWEERRKAVKWDISIPIVQASSKFVGEGAGAIVEREEDVNLLYQRFILS